MVVNRMAEITGTPTQVDQAPIDGSSAPAPAPEPASEPPKDEAAVLRSRLQGQDAKIKALTDTQKAADARATAAEAKLAEYEQGKLGADEALRAQLTAAQEQTAQALKEAKAARLEAKFPETFSVFGEDAALFSEDKLAASEARLQGESAGDAPTPRGNNAPRAGNRAPAKPETIAEVEARLASMIPPWQQPAQ